MRAALCREYGPPEVISVDEHPPPSVGEGAVRVRVHAAAVNFPDVLIVANQYQISVPTPFVPGSELAGVVAELGPGADALGLAVGDRVSGAVIVGAFAEQAVLAATSLTRVPDGIDDRTAAAFGVAHRTAYHVLRSVARVGPGDEVIVLGAGGGVGLAAVQLATLLGASVTAVASSQDKLDAAAAHGARHLIDHRSVPLRAALKDALPAGADAVVDPVGGDLAEPALRSLRWGGRFVTVGYASGTIPRLALNLVLLKGVQVAGFEFLGFRTNRPDEFLRNNQELDALLRSGKAVPHIGATYALDGVALALRHVADGRAIGKVVIDIGP